MQRDGKIGAAFIWTTYAWIWSCGWDLFNLSRLLTRMLQNPARLAALTYKGAAVSARTFGLAVEIDIEVYMRLERDEIDWQSLALACFGMQVHRAKLERRLDQMICSGADRAGKVFCYGFYTWVQYQRLIGKDDIS